MITKKQEERSVVVRFWGVRGSVPSPGPDTVRYGSNTSCVELRAGEQIIILDAGTGIRALGAQLEKEFAEQSLKATLVISHTHWDHIQGLPFFAPGYLERNRIRILAPPGKQTEIQAGLADQMNPNHFPVRLGHLRGLSGIEEMPAEGAALGEFSVRTIELNHPGGCGGFRFEARGVSVAFLPDHEPYRAPGPENEALLEFLRDCDLLILDTQYDETEYLRRIGWGHGCLPDSVALALAAGVKQLAFFHHDPAHSDDKLDEMVEAGKDLVLVSRANLALYAAREREEIKLSAAEKAVANSSGGDR